MAKLSVGIDLSGRRIVNAAVAGMTIPSDKFVAVTNLNNYIAEADDGSAYYHIQGEENVYFYYENRNLRKVFTLPDNFGTITWVDKSSVFYGYLSRTGHEKIYTISEDGARKEYLPILSGTTEMQEGDPLRTGQIYIQYEE